MSFLRRLFTKAKDEDYETVLSSLALDIQKRQTQLSEIRLRERRSTLLVTLYALAAWVAYVSLWYVNILPNLSGHQRSSKVEKAVKGLPVVVGPIVILFTRRIVQIWYMRKGDAEEKTLRELLKKQRSTVEEIKKKTNYYSTRNLIERYDEGSPSNSPLSRALPISGQQTQPATPQRQPPLQRAPVQASMPKALQQHIYASASPQQYAAPPPRKQWYDKLADALLGDDESGPSSKYALICEKCATHNGLVKESMFDDAQYVCPKCGYFNRSAKSKRQSPGRSISPSAASPASSSLALTFPPLVSNGSAPERETQGHEDGGVKRRVVGRERPADEGEVGDVSMMVVDS